MRNTLSTWALGFGLLLLALATPAVAQFPAPLPAPDLDLTGPPFTRAMVRLPDGKLVVAAPFFRTSGLARSYLVRLLPDGSIDTSWNPAPNSPVSGLYVDALGRLYVSGVFTSIAGQPRTRLARFDASGVLDSTWLPTLNNGANAFAPGLAGEICIGGAFTQANGVARNRLACLSTLDGTLNATWNPGANSTVSTLLNANGALYVGGFFTQIGTTPRNFAARIALAGAGTLDAWNPNPNGNVSALIVANVSQLYLSGSFQGISAIARPGVARVDATSGALDAAFAPTGTNVSIMPCLAPDGGTGIYVGGSFTGMGGQPRLNVARLSGANGSAIAGFNPGLDYGYATACVTEPNGDLVIAGPFASAGSGEHLGIARVFANGGVDPQFNTALETNASAFAIARVPGDGSLIVGGEFARAAGFIRRNLVRITPAGAVDPNWNPATDSQVRSLAVDALGRVYVAGPFLRVNTTARAGLARLLNTADGAPDTAWNPATSSVGRVLLRPEGLYVAGGAGSVNFLARVSTGATATVDVGWNPGLDNFVQDFVATLDGSLVVVGGFANAGGQPRAGIAKIGTGATAVVDLVWAPQVTLSTANTLTVAEFDNAIYLSGEITAVNGVGRSRLAKISAVGSGALDVAWAPALTAAQGYALRLAVDASHVYVAGNVGGGFFRPFLQRYGKDDGVIDTTWRPQPDGGLFDVLVEPQRVCVAGFTLQTLGGQARRGFGCLPKLGINDLFADSFED